MTHAYEHKKTQKDSASTSEDAPTSHHSTQTGTPASIPPWASLAYGDAVHPSLRLSAAPVQQKANTTGLPDTLKGGIEHLSGLSMDDVHVHYNSSKPAQVQALAYTQGPEIHVGPGQEQHLAHEVWHVVQQKQGRVKPMSQVKGVAINDDEELEREAGAMSRRMAIHCSSQDLPDRMTSTSSANASSISAGPIQMNVEIEQKRKETMQYSIKDLDNILKALKGAGFKELVPKIQPLLEQILSFERVYHFRSLEEMVYAIQGQNILNWIRHKVNIDKSQLPMKESMQHHTKILKEIKQIELGKYDQSIALAAAFELSKKYKMEFFVKPDQVLAWGDKNLIAQTPQQRGDMTHVLPALQLGNLKVVLCFEKTIDMLSDADQILEYYLPQRQKVCIYPYSMNDIRAPHTLTYATEVLKESARKNPLETRHIIKEMTTGHLTTEDRHSYAHWCKDLGFEKGLQNKYVIVSHRDTGHNVPKGRQPSHPELDTGEDGFIELINIVKKAGFIPVPMGDPKTRFSYKPHLIKYWEDSGKYGFKDRTRRQIEYGLIRYLAEEFGVRLLAMRSGNTDAMAFAGMETIFLDLAGEGAPLQERQAANLTNDAHNRSWRRAALLESILPGIFHQGFFEHPRPNNQESQSSNWSGTFHKDDLTNIEQTVKQFFGEAKQDITIVTARAFNSPISKHKDFSSRLSQETSSKKKTSSRFETFEEFASKVDADREDLLRQPLFILNAVDIELDRITTSLAALQADLDRIEHDLGQLEKQMDVFYEKWLSKLNKVVGLH